MKKIILKLILAVIVIPMSVIATIYWMDKSGFFNLDHIEITIENGRKDPQYLQPLVAELDRKLEKYRGLSLWDLDLNQMAEQVDGLLWIETHYLSRSWPTRLTVRITPKDVKLLFVAKNGQMIPIVEDGSFLPSVSSKQAPDVTLLEGELFEKSLEMRRKAVKTINDIPNKGMFSRGNISELRFDPKEGFWATLIESGIKVKIGEEAIPLKAARVSQVLEYIESRQLEARVIDANLSKKVLVRLRKDP
jgi:cell division protein FtsQ